MLDSSDGVCERGRALLVGPTEEAGDEHVGEGVSSSPALLGEGVSIDG
jgi:hypothetical protein